MMMLESKTARKRKLLWSLLGDLPPRDRPISASVTYREDLRAFRIEWLELDLNGIEPIRACFVSPLHSSGATPVIVYNHAHGGTYSMGCDELINGRKQLLNPPFADVLTQAGCSVLAIDSWNFGARHRRTESSLFKEMLWKGQVLWGMMVYDSIRALDYLETRSDVDALHIGTMGLSMGSTMGWWMAALDERISLCIDLCCLTDFHALIEADGLDLHGLYYFVPALLKHFTTSEINSLIAPRMHLSLAGLRDPLTPVEGLRKVDAALKQIYEQLGAPESWKLSLHDCGHEETPEMRTEICQWIERWTHGR